MAQAPTIDCRTCGTTISRKAYDCPQCGEPNRKPKRGFFGKLFKWSFIAWNVLMAVWIFGGVAGNSVEMQEYATQAERDGFAVGTGIGVVMLLFLWVLGDIILGLLTLMTRPRK